MVEKKLQKDENKLIAQRKEKLQRLRQQQKIVFANDFRPNSNAKELQAFGEGKDKKSLEADKISIKEAGRLMLNRGSFMVIQDVTDRIQLYVDRHNLPDNVLAAIETWDLGDIIGAEGYLSRSNKGDLLFI